MSRTDGSVVINIIADDKEAQKVLGTLKDIENASKGMGKGTGNPFKDMPDGANKANLSIKNLTTSILASNVAMKALNVVTESFGAAMGRFDTMKRFPKMMEQMGFSSEQSERSIRKLSKGIEGLPTRLDEVVATTQGLASMTGDLNRATDLTLALNNAFLASGSSSMDASRGLTQFTQMLSNGKVDLQSWKTLQETMPIGLQKVAESFGFAGESAKQNFYEALKDGKITFSQFGDRLVELNEAVGGFAELALTGAEGIATSFQNVKTAVINGLAGIITAFDKVLEKATGKTVAQNLDGLKGVVRGVFNAINKAIESAAPFIELFIKGIITLYDIVVKLSPAIEALAVGFLMFKSLTMVTTLIGTFGNVIFAAQFKVLLLQETWQKLMALIVANPFIAVAAAIATVGYAIYKWFNRVSPEVEEFASAVDESVKNTKELSDAQKEAKENFRSTERQIQSASDTMKKTADSAFLLADRQKRTAGDTKKLKDAIEELNGYFGANTVAIDENTGKLNLSREAMDAYFAAAEKEKQLEATKERSIELDKEQIELDRQKKVNNENLLLAKQKLDEASWNEFGTKKELKKAIEELEAEQEQIAINEGIRASDKAFIIEQEKQLYQEVGQASEELAAKMEEHASRRILSLEELDERERAVAEGLKESYNSIKDAATDMFDKINTKSKLTHEEMLENLQHNAKAVEDWATNISTLSKRGIDEGLLNQLRQMGPEGAGYVAELVTMTDDELIKFNEAFRKGGEASANNLITAWDLEKGNVRNGVFALIVEATNGLTDGVNSMGWSDHGKNIVDGVIEGITSNTGNATKESVNMANEMVKSFTSVLGIHSPSTVFTTFGHNIIQGLVNGLTSNKQNAIEQARGVSSSIASAANDEMLKAKSGANYAGAMMGAGLSGGLESKRGGVIATARSIASAASMAMSAALKINSPSKVTTEIGEFTGEGLEVGMESKINAIKKVAKSLAQSAIPEINQSEAQRITNNNNGNMINHNSSNVNIEKIEWSGKEDIRKTMDEIGWITGQESWRLQEV